MIQRIAAHVWNDSLEDFVEVPLDEAPAWIVQVARLVVGKDISDEELARISRRLECAEQAQ